MKLRFINFDTSPTWSVAHLNFTSATDETPGTTRHHQSSEKSNTSSHWVFENWKYSNCHELTYRTIWTLIKQCVGSHGNMLETLVLFKLRMLFIKLAMLWNCEQICPHYVVELLCQRQDHIHVGVASLEKLKCSPNISSKVINKYLISNLCCFYKDFFDLFYFPLLPLHFYSLDFALSLYCVRQFQVENSNQKVDVTKCFLTSWLRSTCDKDDWFWGYQRDSF